MGKKINLSPGLRELIAESCSGCFMGLVQGVLAGLVFLVLSLGLTMLIIGEALLDFGLLKFLFGVLLLGCYFILTLGLLVGFSLGNLLRGLIFGVNFGLGFALGFVLANLIPFLLFYILGLILFTLCSLLRS